MTILAKTFLPAKTIFVSPVFTMEKTGFSTVWQKPANLVSVSSHFAQSHFAQSQFAQWVTVRGLRVGVRG